MHTIAGILQRRARTAAARPVFVRSAQARAATLALSRHSPGWNAQPARPRVNAAASAATSASAASRAARPRLHLAAIHRTMAR